MNAAQFHLARLRIRPEVSLDSLGDKNNQADNQQRTEQSVSEHCCLLVFDWRLSMKCSGKGSFPANKLQRLARTTVCSHPAKGMATAFH
jgi:hypothetical protein